MAASAALMVDFKKGSVSLGKSNVKLTFMPSMCISSASISLSMIFFFVPAYITVANASFISLGYNVMMFLLFRYANVSINWVCAKQKAEIWHSALPLAPLQRERGSGMLCCYGANVLFVFLAYSLMGTPTTTSVRSALVLWAFTFTPTVSPLSQGKA